MLRWERGSAEALRRGAGWTTAGGGGGRAPVVAIVSENDLWAQEDHAAVQKEGAAVVADAIVDDGKANVHHDAWRRIGMLASVRQRCGVCVKR